MMVWLVLSLALRIHGSSVSSNESINEDVDHSLEWIGTRNKNDSLVEQN